MFRVWFLGSQRHVLLSVHHQQYHQQHRESSSSSPFPTFKCLFIKSSLTLLAARAVALLAVLGPLVDAMWLHRQLDIGSGVGDGEPPGLGGGDNNQESAKERST